MIKRLGFTIFTFMLCFSCLAQSQKTAFEFLKIPISSKSSSLGGNVVSVTDPDPAMASSNPALLDNIEQTSISLNFMNYIANTKVAGIQYSVPHDDMSSYAVSVNYVDYGSMDKTEADGTTVGTFNAKDINIGCIYSYKLGQDLSGGIAGRIIYSKYGTYSSVAASVDLGLLYSLPDRSVDLGIAAKNIGGQIKAFDNQFEELPFNLAVGCSWSPEHAPIRFTLTLNDLTKWKSEYFYTYNQLPINFIEIIKRHVILGADFNITEQIYVAAGANIRNRIEMAGSGRKGLTGLHIGTGINLDKIMMGISYGQYQISTSSLLINFAYNL
ncbi:MAG: type IX secretion system protein PorQ [Bacteroidaceae bacterium]|nr:type IX secretion system protein PorQ [Bacteroidaceae bacterium]MBO7247842.1 type IX secretion system protein PorQ [Bacteroidaceae bacterium]